MSGGYYPAYGLLGGLLGTTTGNLGPPIQWNYELQNREIAWAPMQGLFGSPGAPSPPPVVPKPPAKRSDNLAWLDRRVAEICVAL